MLFSVRLTVLTLNTYPNPNPNHNHNLQTLGRKIAWSRPNCPFLATEHIIYDEAVSSHIGGTTILVCRVCNNDNSYTARYYPAVRYYSTTELALVSEDEDGWHLMLTLHILTLTLSLTVTLTLILTLSLTLIVTIVHKNLRNKRNISFQFVML